MLVYDHIKSPRIVRRASLNIKGQFKEPITVFSVLFVLSDYQIVQKRSKYIFNRLWTNIAANDDEMEIKSTEELSKRGHLYHFYHRNISQTGFTDT